MSAVEPVVFDHAGVMWAVRPAGDRAYRVARDDDPQERTLVEFPSPFPSPEYRPPAGIIAHARGALVELGTADWAAALGRRPYWRGVLEESIAGLEDVGEAAVEVPVRVIRPALREVDRLTSELCDANGNLAAVRDERDEYATELLSANGGSVPEIACPGCGATIRARLADQSSPVTTEEVAAWDRARFGSRELHLVALKLAEEVGEVAGAVTKRAEGAVRPEKGLTTWEEWTAHLHTEIGDVSIALHALAGREGTTVDELTRIRFREDVALRTGQERPPAVPVQPSPNAMRGEALALEARAEQLRQRADAIQAGVG